MALSVMFSVYTIQLFDLMMTYLHQGGTVASVFEHHFRQEWLMALCMVPIAFFLGFVYEVSARMIMYIASAVILVVLAVFMHPLENSGWFAVIFFSRAAFTAIFINPMVNDFIKECTRGVGVAIEVLGWAAG